MKMDFDHFLRYSSDLSMSKPYLIAPSIYLLILRVWVKTCGKVLAAAGADVVHFDVMDNHYVPNLTFGAGICKALKNYGIKAPIDVHLMVSPVDRMIGDFLEAGADIITFHPEASDHIDRSYNWSNRVGQKAGLVFNPATPLHYLDYVFDKVDQILLMSVNRLWWTEIHSNDFGKITSGTSDYWCQWSWYSSGSGWWCWPTNIREIAEAGADMFVAGSAIFGPRL